MIFCHLETYIACIDVFVADIMTSLWSAIKSCRSGWCPRHGLPCVVCRVSNAVKYSQATQPGRPFSARRLDLHNCMETIQKDSWLAWLTEGTSNLSMGVSVHEAPQKLAGYSTDKIAADAMT